MPLDIDVSPGTPEKPAHFDSKPARRRWTELGSAKRLVEEHGDEIRYSPGVGWLIWTGTHWHRDEADQVHRYAKLIAEGDAVALDQGEVDDADRSAAKRHVARVQSAGGVAGVLRLARSEDGIIVKAEQLDAHRHLLNFTNGTLDVTTGKLRRHDRRDLLTICLPYAFDTEAKAPRFRQFLEEIQPRRDMQDYLQRVAGYAATGMISEQEFWLFHGNGANGKNVFVDTVVHALGNYAMVASEGLFVSGSKYEHPSELADLQGKRLVVASETEEDARLKVGLVKKLTGDAKVKARRLYQQGFEFELTNKSWMISNHRPKVEDGSNAIWRRMRLVPFSVKIPKLRRDRHLLDKLKSETPGIMAWIIKGCLAWQQDGLNPPDLVSQATDRYQDESDRLAEYKPRLVTGDGLWIDRKELYDDYAEWAKESDEGDVLGRKQFFDRIRQIPGVEDEERFIGGKQRGFKGIDFAWREGAMQS